VELTVGHRLRMRLNAAEVEHWPDLVLGELRPLRFDVVAAQDAGGNSSWLSASVPITRLVSIKNCSHKGNPFRTNWRRNGGRRHVSSAAWFNLQRRPRWTSSDHAWLTSIIIQMRDLGGSRRPPPTIIL